MTALRAWNHGRGTREADGSIKPGVKPSEPQELVVRENQGVRVAADSLKRPEGPPFNSHDRKVVVCDI
jgi:hypothetical protein